MPLFNVARTLRVRKFRHSESAGYGITAALLCFATSLSAADPSADGEHLLYLADQGLGVIRLRIEIDGKSQRELCRTCLEAICIEADRDRDQSLTDVEYDARIATHPVLQERQARTMTMRPNAKPDRPDFGSRGRLSIEEMTDYLLRRAGSPLIMEFATSQMRRINNAGELLDRPMADTELFERLDTDGNRKLTSREIERAAGVLARLDFDEDEAISLAELRMQTAPAAMAAMPNRPASRSDGHFSLLAADRIDAQFVRRVLSRYDGEAKGSAKDLRLDRAETGLPETIFSAADADADGYWDFDELWRFLVRPLPTVDITVRFQTGSATAAEFTPADPSAAKLLEQRPGLVSFDIHGTRMQFLLPPNEPPNHGWDGVQTVQFQSLDADKNEYLEAAEYPFGGNGEDASPIFQAMDVNGDGKVYLAEYLAYFRRDQFARASFLLIEVENLERTLFGPLDINGDGRLSPRELAGLKAKVAEWDADGDGKLVESEIPQQYRLKLSHGGRLAFGGPSFPGDSDPTSAAPAAGPLWFRKMDRNRDGEVSLREFLGTPAQFEKIDANGDGAIDADEAARVK